MRDPQRISRIIQKLAAIWTNNPDLKFGQLMLGFVWPYELGLLEDDELELQIDNQFPEFSKMEFIFATNYDDWEGLYFNGKLIKEGHHIDWREILKAGGLDLTVKEVDQEWLANGPGCLPKNIEDVKWAE